MPEIKFNWLNTKYVTLYSNWRVVCVTAMRKINTTIQMETNKIYRQNKTDDEDFTFQISAIGLELGSTISGFTELGYGDQGILIVGLKCKF